MTIIATATLVLLCIVALCVLSIVVSRRGAARPYKVAFYAGLSGLVALPALLISFVGLAAQIPYITLAGVSGALFIASGAILFIATCMCILALLTVRQGRPRAA